MKTLSNQAAAAKAIRAELKKLYPSTKFSVTSQGYSMGDSVRVSWDNGPTLEMVNGIIKKYQYGTFDGMTDCYNNDRVDSSIPQTKYVMSTRTITEDHYLVAFEYIKKHYAHCDHLTDLDTSDLKLNEKWMAWTPRNLIYRTLAKVDLTQPLNMEAI